MRIYLSLFYFSYFSLVGVYVMFMPEALTGFGYSKSEVGTVYAVAPIIRFLLPFIFKYYIKLTAKIYLLALFLTFIASLLFIGTVHNFYFHLFSNAILGAAMGITLPYVETISLQQLSKKMYGKIRLWGSVGFILIALWLGKIDASPIEIIYYLCVTTFFTWIFGYFILQFDTYEATRESDIEKGFSLQRYWAFWVSIFLMQVAFGGFYTFFTIYEAEQGVSKEIISYLWSFAVVCEILMLYFQGPLLQRNLLTLLKAATLITAFRWLLLYLYPSSLEITFFSQSLHAISFALYHTAAISYVFSIYTQKRLAQQFFLGISFGLGGGVGSLVSGYIYESKAYGEYLFLVESLITIAAFIMLLIHTKRKKAILLKE
ncbi:MAG: Probable 3-phenylpropionic acid transporter [uncultured Sulfurovum sp.]|uniref:Probable 3-phenylpropionic acid transporter n=1 Tax=uncultured Sulfurovum sp. TaxID=269237 RepID=A0A6S6RSC1_9BACT|nr:MAG: Probable 3-phenylpropionic acid transporter [uncultured Sulfurovum sp.]